jgi:sec-independent protein translocase protein TatB
MFDVSWSEVLVIGVVALLVVGPKELPALLRTVGKYVGMIKRQASDFRAQFDEAMRESEIEQLKKDVEGLGKDIETTVREAESSVQKEMDDARREFDAVAQSAGSAGHGVNGVAAQADVIADLAAAEAPAPAVAPKSAAAVAAEAVTKSGA